MEEAQEDTYDKGRHGGGAEEEEEEAEMEEKAEEEVEEDAEADDELEELCSSSSHKQIHIISSSPEGRQRIYNHKMNG